ncbi:MAG: hypothetical protein BMS9Abin10_1055 [Gammaproteobacteria bacterium]|nr:MAG: hypothetical protein BMS9Abin10_1055 [Gammaproteobacteria bacterium]
MHLVHRAARAKTNPIPFSLFPLEPKSMRSKVRALIRRPELARMGRTLLYGAVGGAVFYWFIMPLA